MKIDPEISSLKSLISALKAEVTVDHTKIEKLESQIQELKLNYGSGKKDINPLSNEDVEIDDDESDDIRSSRNKAAIVHKKIEASQKKQQKEEKSDVTNLRNSCPAKKLFYSNEGDIQMLHAYEIIPFDNKNGGVWYQGFDITYDAEKIKEEEQLEVFVVPHSHNDPEIPTGAWVMTDEANSHLYSIVTEMFEGHEFLMNTIGVRPKNHWSIDPFGLSPTVSYLLRQANITNLAINRVHYAVKKFLAESKDLEFHWRQLWAGKSDKTDVFTHMFPFGGYDIPSTCGPDRKVSENL
uniref:Glycoside hydrolase family 38 N-terminal domain-containing protein n=1 Tax=Panagrolaimus sp. ES5 TaxID=591445 RepID=A0AC34F0I2_9BILA